MAREPELGDVATHFLFENDRVRVWEMRLEPGESSAPHRHTLPYLLCVIEGERIDADLPDGRTLEIPVTPGTVLFVPPGSTETAVNRSAVRFREILIELKGPGPS
jgi:quercetin dioxygenase-like cupin family protein